MCEKEGRFGNEVAAEEVEICKKRENNVVTVKLEVVQVENISKGKGGGMQYKYNTR